MTTGLRRLLWLFAIAILAACDATPPPPGGGFLGSYRRLQRSGASTLRYVDDVRFARFDRFIVEPVVMHVPFGEEPLDIPDEQRAALTEFLHAALVDALAGAYPLETEPGPRVARIRVALTDVKRSMPPSDTMPSARTSAGTVGGASIEAEILDARTGEQLAAFVESRLATPVDPSAARSEWADAESVMTGWAASLRRRIDATHGR